MRSAICYDRDRTSVAGFEGYMYIQGLSRRVSDEVAWRVGGERYLKFSCGRVRKDATVGILGGTSERAERQCCDLYCFRSREGVVAAENHARCSQGTKVVSDEEEAGLACQYKDVSVSSTWRVGHRLCLHQYVV